MTSIVQLSQQQCILLAAHLARASSIGQLQNLTATRRDAFTNELVLQILLTCLPESADPSTYISYAEQISNNIWEIHDASTTDTSSVADISQAKVKRRIQALNLQSLAHTVCQSWEDQDLMTLFLVSRSYRVDQEANLLVLVPQLVGPFIDTSRDLKTWFISSVLPLLRLQYEYYPTIAEEDGDDAPENVQSLDQFSQLSGLSGVRSLLLRSHEPADAQTDTTYHGARDIKGLVGPWMYGSSARKRRKLNGSQRRPSVPVEALRDLQQITDTAEGVGSYTQHHEWEQAFEYLVQEASENFEYVTETIEQWDGPMDVDLGGFDDRQPDLDEQATKDLRDRYVQATIASIYAVRSDSLITIERAHRLLIRLADLMDMEPPPDLATSVDMLPRIDAQSAILSQTTAAALLENVLIQPGHPLTTPDTKTYALLHLFIFSAYLLDGMKCSTSIRGVAQTRFQSSAEEQLQALEKVLRLAAAGPRKDDSHWDVTRQKLLWLWNWGFSNPQPDDTTYGEGYFGKLEKRVVEKEILKACLTAGCFELVKTTYLPTNAEGATQNLPSRAEVEEIIMQVALQYYDNASNGNRTRGSMKKASDIIATFRSLFPQSQSFKSCEALIAATHALSFYSLTLQHGIPFQPVNIRVSHDRLSLITKVLEQNPQSYSKLEDMIGIGKSLVAAGALIAPAEGAAASVPKAPFSAELALDKAERRIIGMAIEQALAEDDFETAYSYVTARLSTSSAGASPDWSDDVTGDEDDDDNVAWRAAFVAGRHRSALDVSGATVSSGAANLRRPGQRRLEQRMELLAQALLLAPPAHLPEILAAWRRCEEEMSVLAAEEADEESISEDQHLPGGFDPAISPVQTRREVGRGATEESPMGLFDVAKGAAAALSRTAFPLRGSARQSRNVAPTGKIEKVAYNQTTSSARNSSDVADGDRTDVGGQERARKRDIVANAASGALASGLGWMLGT